MRYEEEPGFEIFEETWPTAKIVIAFPDQTDANKVRYLTIATQHLRCELREKGSALTITGLFTISKETDTPPEL